ncbi:MAG: L-threonylcarbamoyladenylate synthase [bacterium]
MVHEKEITVIKKDGIGVFPTDTLYGIVGDAFSKKAVERIYTAKGRSKGKPFIVLISSIADIKKFGIVLNKKQKELLAEVWPGPVSVILPCKSKKFEYLHRGKNSLAFRFPKKKKVLEFIKETGPLVAPSANPQGMIPSHTIAEAKDYFGSDMDFYISGGMLDSKPSKIIFLTDKGIKVLRD